MVSSGTSAFRATFQKQAEQPEGKQADFAENLPTEAIDCLAGRSSGRYHAGKHLAT